MSTRRCELCETNMPNDQFGEHMDGHSDLDFNRWPGGASALMLEIRRSLAESAGDSALTQWCPEGGIVTDDHVGQPCGDYHLDPLGITAAEKRRRTGEYQAARPN